MMFIVFISDRSSTDHSLPDDDLQLSDEEDSLIDTMVKHIKSERFRDPKGQKMMVSSRKLLQKY
jgi:hypothetical protein